MLEPYLPSFQLELEKLALDISGVASKAKALVGNQVGATGAGIGIGALGGAAMGGAGGAAGSYRKARQEGGSMLGSALHGLAGATGGALSGAAGGAAAGGILGAAGGGRARDVAKTITSRKDLLGSAGRFGQRQVHGLTDALPAGHGSRTQALHAIGLGTPDAKARVQAANAALVGKAGPELAKAQKAADAAKKSLATTADAERMGLTSLPGVAKSFAQRPIDTTKTLLKNTWEGGTAAEKVMNIGMPVGMAAASLATQNKDSEPGKAERGLSHLGVLAGAPILPLSGAIAVQGLARRGLKTLGSGIDTQLHRKADPQ